VFVTAGHVPPYYSHLSLASTSIPILWDLTHVIAYVLRFGASSCRSEASTASTAGVRSPRVSNSTLSQKCIPSAPSSKSPPAPPSPSEFVPLPILHHRCAGKFLLHTMSSPFHSPDRSRSTPRSSPSRQRLSDSRRVGQINGFHRPYRESPQRESPSRPLWEEFERLYVREENNFRQSLDAQDAEQERLHKQQLREALEQHEAVRQSAERARERLELEIKKESQRREEEEKRAVEEARRKLAEQEEVARRRQIEENKQREEESRRREALQREKEEQERQIAARKLREEQEKLQREATRQREEAECKSREDAIAKEQAQTQKPEPLPIQQSQHHQSNGITAAPAAHSAASAPTGLTPGLSGGAMQGLVTTVGEREGVHKRYVSLHQRLKVMRKSIVDECKRRGFKQLGDWRREIRVNCGQLNKLNKDSNRNNVSPTSSRHCPVIS